MKNKQKIFNIEIDNLSMSETLEVINNSINNETPLLHIVVNAAKLVNMQKDSALYESIKSADIVNADGMAVVWAAKFVGKELKERVSGIDLFVKLVENAHLRKEKVFLLGAREEVVKIVAEKFQMQYGKDIIGGYRNGYFKKGNEKEIIEQIRDSGAKYLFVAISSPFKEIFLSTYKKELSELGFIMGVGGSFDVVSGKVKRAPLWMQKIGMEWFYRFLQEPRRMWKRSFIDNGKFIGLVIKEKFKK